MGRESAKRKRNRAPEDLTTADPARAGRGGAPGVAAPTGPLIAGRYEVLEQLGKGGMGAVFKVRDHNMGRRLIALKRILKLDDRARGRFESEIHSAANLNHRNICKVHDCGEDGEGPFFTMELLTGGSLADRVKANGPQSHEAVADLARQLAQALRYAHRRSVQHRDIKPTNVLFAAEDGDPKLADFGIARIGPPSELSQTNFGLGTPGFAAPEQLASSKAADHRADIYSLGATLYFALTGKAPRDDADLSGLAPFWQTLIGKCMKADPAERYFDASEVLDALARTAEPGPALTEQCSVCGAGNPSGCGFCRKCGAGLREPCPGCGRPNRAGQGVCTHCGVDIPKRWADVTRPGAARDRGSRHDAGSRDAPRGEARLVHADARILKQLEELRDEALLLESQQKHAEAEQVWHRVLDIQPDHRQAVAAIERLRGTRLDERFVEKAGEFRTAIEARDMPRATRLLLEMRTIAGPASVSELPQCEQALETLRRTLVIDLKEAFDAALQRRRRKTARSVIGKLTELHLDAAEVTAMLERLKSADRRWRRRRTGRRLTGVAVLLVSVAGGYLLVADQHNQIVARAAAEDLAAGEAPDLEGFLPAWPRDERFVLAERSKLCTALDGRYGSGDWRRSVEDVALFGSRREAAELVAAFNWLVLRQVAASAAAGSDADLDRARELTGKIAWRELGPRGEPFRVRSDALQEILGGWYDGPLSLEVFADAHLAGAPEQAFVAEQATTITDPRTECETIDRLTRLMERLGEGGHIAEQVRAHNERVIDAIGASVDDPRSSRIANLLNNLCVETGDPAQARRDLDRALGRLVDELEERAERDPALRPNVVALLAAIDRGMTEPPAALEPAIELLVHQQAVALLPRIEHAFRTEGDVGALLARLQAQTDYWSYLDEQAAAGLRERERRLRELHERWSVGPLLVAPLCRLDVDQPWLEFRQSTESRAIDAFYARDAGRAADLAGLLRAFDHDTQPLRDLAVRILIHEALGELDGVLAEPAAGELRQRLLTRADPAETITTQLATEVVLAGIEAQAHGAALRLAPAAGDPGLAVIARHAGQLADLPEPALRELEATVLDDARLPVTSRRIRDEVERRLERCLPVSGTLQSPGQLTLGQVHAVSHVSVQAKGNIDRRLDPLGPGGHVYRVPFLEAGEVTLTLQDEFGITISRPFTIAHSMLADPAEVTLRSARVVAGEPAVLTIRPRLAFDRVTVEGVDRTDDLVDLGDHWRLDLATSLEPGQPAASRQWDLLLLTQEGVQRLEVPFTVVAPALVAAETALERGEYEVVFDRLAGFERRDHEALRRLEHAASSRWIERMRGADPDARTGADALVNECRRFLAKVPALLHQEAAAIRDRAWIRRIELTTTWSSVDALRDDLAFLRGLQNTGEAERRMTAWLAGASVWARSIVEYMERRPGDWTTVHDRARGTMPAVLVHRRSGLEFVYVPAGSFGIGGHSRAPQETPHREVMLTGFYAARTECTRAAWAAGQRDPRPPAGEAHLPVTGISFVEAIAWCHAQGLDLPTEAQWELAAAGFDSREYPWGTGDCQPNVKRAFRNSEIAEVDSVECDRSPFGAMDMAGNVREWCYPVSNATYRVLLDGTRDPPAWLDGVTVRGASWQDPVKEARTHHRLFAPGSPSEVGKADPAVGFRPVLNLGSR